MKPWSETQHHARLSAYGLQLSMSASPTTRLPAEPLVGHESHHYVLREPGVHPTEWDRKTIDEIQQKIRADLASANLHSRDSPFGPVQIDVRRSKRNGLTVVARRPWPAISRTPFRTNEPPTEWKNSRVHAVLTDRNLYFQRAYTQGRYNVFEYLLDVSKELEKSQTAIREILRGYVADALNVGVRGVMNTYWHPFRGAEDAYQHALVVQVKLRIKPDGTTPTG